MGDKHTQRTGVPRVGADRYKWAQIENTVRCPVCDPWLGDIGLRLFAHNFITERPLWRPLYYREIPWRRVVITDHTVLDEIPHQESHHQNLSCWVLSGWCLAKHCFCLVPFAFGLGEQVERCLGYFTFWWQVPSGWWPSRCGLIIDSTSMQLRVVQEEVEVFPEIQLLHWKATPLNIQTQWKTGLSSQWPLLRLRSLEKLKGLLLLTPTLMWMAPYQVI